MKLPKISIDNYQFTLVVFLLITIAGIISLLKMPRTENPEISIPGGAIYVVYPGANPLDMEELIANPIEESINELEDIKKIETTLSDGMAVISVEFIYGTDAKEKYNEMVQRVNAVHNELPEDILYLELMEWKSSDVATLQLAFSSEHAEYAHLYDKAEQLKDQLNKVRELRKIEIVANPEEEVRVSLNIRKMSQMNISVQQVAEAIASNNANIPGGQLKIGPKSFSVKTSGSYENIEEIGNTVVHSYQGRLIYLKNIADIYFTYEDIRYIARFNGTRAIFLTVKQKEGLNIFRIKKKTEPIIENFKKGLDEEIALNYVFDQSKEVNDKINGFLGNLLQGIVLVGIVIFLALGFRSSLIVMLAIPLSIVMGLHFVDLAGYGLEQISIAGLVVALGLLVDNNIVMIENINRYIRMGYPPKDASVNAASEVGWPVASATATTLLAFIPILTMPDKAGDFIRSLPLTIIATLAYSLLIALTLTPLIASRTFKMNTKQHKNDIHKKINEHTHKVRENFVHRKLNILIEGPYRQTLKFAFKNKTFTILFAVLILLITLFSARFLGVSFFPKAEKPQFMIRVNLPEGTNLDKTDSVAIYVEHEIQKIPNLKYFATNVGHGNPRIYYNEIPRSYSLNFAEIFVQLEYYEIEEFDQLIVDLRDKFSAFPGAKITVSEFEQGVPVSSPVMVYIHGDNFDIIRDIADEVEMILKKQPGAINTENHLAKEKSDLHIKINKDKASVYGIPLVEIDRTVRAAINGVAVSKYRDSDGVEYNIVLRLPFEDKVKTEQLDDIYVKSLSGKLVPLKQVAGVEFKKARTSINRYNLERAALVTSDLAKDAYLDDIMSPVIQFLENYDFPDGYSYHIGGELESRQETFGGMMNAIFIAAIAIFAVLVLQFRSFLQPLIIFAAIPFAMIGMVWALFLTGNTFSFTAFVGLISLIGIVINNSIILVDYTNQLIRKGNAPEEALRIAGETRFTPIILTTFTTIGGLLPLTLGGGTLWAPMGWTIIGGLLVSTFLTLVIVPLLYLILEKKVISTTENHIGSKLTGNS